MGRQTKLSHVVLAAIGTSLLCVSRVEAGDVLHKVMVPMRDGTQLATFPDREYAFLPRAPGQIVPETTHDRWRPRGVCL